MDETPQKKEQTEASAPPAGPAAGPKAAGEGAPPEAPAAAAGAEDLAVLREKAAKADEYLDLAKRARADFLNYQERVRRERAEWTRQAVADFLADFLPAMDAFALARFEDPKLLEAVRLIEREFLRVLAKWGAVPVETAGRKFDPLYHEAVAVQETAERPEGTILEEVRRGWRMGDRVIRPASVRIARPPSVPAGGAAPSSPPP